MLHTEIGQGLGPAEQGPQIKRLYEGGCNMCQTSPSVALPLLWKSSHWVSDESKTNVSCNVFSQHLCSGEH